MASLKFRHYATESALKGNGTVQNALNAFDVGTIVFIDDTQKQYIITSKSNNVVTYKIYYGEAAVIGISGSGATREFTFSDGSVIDVKINDVEHAISADTADTAKSVDWNNVSGKPTNFVTTDDTQTITGAKIFTNNISLQGSTSADSITTEDLIVNGAARFVSGLTGDLKGDVIGNVTGNVTGNVSGSSGSCTGNALTATTLQTARSINGTSFNGSQAITTAKWGTARTITIADNTNEHTQANNSIDGSADFTLKLPTTIKADIIGNASTADSAKSVTWANVTNKPNLVTTDTEQTITGAKIFNNNTTFKNETNVESLTADSLLVTGSARFTNTINGNLKGDVEGNLTGNASTATTAATATEFSANKTVALTGDVTGSASSKGGWSVATTIANGAVTNAKLANSKITIAGTAVSLGGSIAASTIGNALTTSAPAAYATNAGSATKAAEAEKAIKDSDGNAINTTYLKKSGGTVSGALTLNGATTVNSTLTADSVTASNLTVNGAAKFNNSLEGNLKGNVDGNATTATTCTGNAATATTATNLANKPSGSFTVATASADASLTITAGGKTSDAITIGKVKSAFTADSAITATSCSGNAATATLANEAKNLQNTTPETKDESFFSKVVTEDADMVSFQTLKGNSVVWNQIIAKPYTYGDVRNSTFSSWYNGGNRSINDKGQFVFITNGGTTGVGNALNITPRNTHKYLLSYKVKADIASVCTIYKMRDSGVIANIAEADKWYFVSCIGDNNDTGNYSSYLNAVVAANSPETTVTIDDAQVIDLTQMFGAGNEPTTYEEFLSRKPKVADEYAYNEGTIVNNKVEGIKTTGVNIWNEQWEVGSIKITTGEDSSEQDRIRMKGYLPVLPNTSYYCTLMSDDSTKRGYFCYYDQNKKHIAYSGNPSQYEMNRVFTTPSNCYFVRFYLNVEYGNTYNHDVCINLSDPAINGQYFPYEKHELDLSWVKEIKNGEGAKLFEDGMKSAGTAFDEAAKGKVIKRIGVKVFDGTETFIDYLVDYGSFAIMRDALVGVSSSIGISNRYVVSKLWIFDPDRTKYDKQIYIDSINNRVWIRDSAFAGVDSLKQYLAELYTNGTPLVLYYELVEPIEVELPYGINHTLPVWKDGMMYAESSQSSTPIVCTNAYYTNIRESVKKFIGDADSIYASTSGYNAHGTWNIDISGKASSAITANSAITATSATTATTCTGNAGTATTLQNTRKINGTDFNGSADITTSKWGTARNITISDGTNSGTATSVDGSGAITLNLPGTIKANLSGNASTATKATNADRATGDSDGNTINTTYLKRSGGTVTGNVTFNSSVTADSITTEDLIVNGAGRFISGITGDLVGNVTGNVTGNLSGNASSATKAINDGEGNTITSTYATKTERANNDITAASLTASKLTLTRTAGNIEVNIPTWNQNTTGTAAKATADAKGNNIINTYATKAEVAALPKSMVIKGTLDAGHALPTSGMTEGDTYIVGASGTYNSIACKVGDFFVRTSDGWLRVPAGDEWEYNENTIKGIKVNNAGHADTADTAVSAGSATSDSNGNNIVNTYARIDKVYNDSSTYRQFLGKSGSSSDWIRTTTNGILPYTSGDASNGHSSLGTSSWYFSKAYIQNIYGYLNGNISGSSTSCSGNSATATTATNVNGGYGNLTSLITNNIVMYPFGGYGSNNTSANQYFRIKLGTTFDNSAMIVFDVIFRHYGQIVKYSIESYLYGNTNKWYMPCVTALTNISSILNEKVLFAYDSENHPIVYIKRTGGAYDQCWVENIRVGLAGTITNFNNVSISNVDGIIEGDTKQVEKTPITWASNAISADIATSAISANTATTATKAGYLDTGTMTLYAHNSNEINFGGTSASSEIYFGYRATESKPIPTSFIFGGSGTATLTAGGFKKSGSSSSYVLTGDGGHAAISELSVKYAASSGACTGNAATTTKLQTARTIWGQSFDGSGNVSGDIINTGNIRPSATKTSNLGSNTLSYKYVYATWFGAPSSTAVSFGASNETHLTINASGNVGIGTTSPTSKLYVAGTGYFASDVSSASNIIAGGYIKGETVKISSGCTLEYSSTDKCVRFVFN